MRIVVAQRLRHGVLGLGALALITNCIATGSDQVLSSHAGNPEVIGGTIRPSFQSALRLGRDLGTIPSGMILHLSLGLRQRHVKELDELIARGRRVSPQAYARRFGADPVAVRNLLAALRAAGMTPSWRTGETSVEATATDGAAKRFFHVIIHRHVGPDGTRFYAPTRPASVPARWRSIVTSVTGFNSYPHIETEAIPSEIGVSPEDMLGFYHVLPLRDAGLNGQGQTVYFVEVDKFGGYGLDRYAAKFHLPPFHVKVLTNPGRWGNPVPEQSFGRTSEADLDLEVVHGIAPGASLVVVDAGDRYDVALRDLLQDHPGAIVSVSLGWCETSEKQIDPGAPSQDASAARKAAGTGTSIFISSGDRGAYGCVPAGDNNSVVPSYLSSMPDVTGVGGTTAFLSSNGKGATRRTKYFKEAAWGEPAEQWGSGGGVSTLFRRQGWQRGPGVDNQYSNGMRQSPDVAANADLQSGWDITGGTTKGTFAEAPVGGTSAAAPFWAAITALIDEDLARQHRASIGFANPALYYFAQNPPQLPAPAFHDITEGTNLLYPATHGWDYATGLGTPDVAALADDFEWFRSR